MRVDEELAGSVTNTVCQFVIEAERDGRSLPCSALTWKASVHPHASEVWDASREGNMTTRRAC